MEQLKTLSLKDFTTEEVSKLKLITLGNFPAGTL